MRLKLLIAVFTLIVSLPLCFSQNGEKKAVSEQEQLTADYKAKKNKR
ncbi:MAG: hypothetical protein ACJARX_001156 [Psychroserpens sp.]|jgi:hypothetical protein